MALLPVVAAAGVDTLIKDVAVGGGYVVGEGVFQVLAGQEWVLHLVKPIFFFLEQIDHVYYPYHAEPKEQRIDLAEDLGELGRDLKCPILLLTTLRLLSIIVGHDQSNRLKQIIFDTADDKNGRHGVVEYPLDENGPF